MDSVIEFARPDRVSEALSRAPAHGSLLIDRAGDGGGVARLPARRGDSFAQVHRATDASRMC